MNKKIVNGLHPRYSSYRTLIKRLNKRKYYDQNEQIKQYLKNFPYNQNKDINLNLNNKLKINKKRIKPSEQVVAENRKE